MQRISKYGDMQNIILTSDKELNSLVYILNAFLYDVMQELYVFL